MIDQFVVFEQGGTVLWKQSYVPLKGSPIDSFVRKVLLEDRAAMAEFVTAGNRVQWVLENELGLVFACVSPQVIAVPYAADLLALTKVGFLEKYVPLLSQVDGDWDAVDCSDFSALFTKLRVKAESIARAKPHLSQKRSAEDKAPTQPPGPPAEKTEGPEADTPAEDTKALSKEEEIMRNRQRFAAARGRAKATAARKPHNSAPADVRHQKVMRESSKPARVSVQEMKEFDHSSAQGAPSDPTSSVREVTEAEVEQNRQKYMNADEASNYNLLDELPDDDEEEGDGDDEIASLAERALGEKTTGTAKATQSTSSSRVFGFFKGLTGRKDLTREDLAPAVAEFREMLISKNVAADIAEKLCDSVATSLIGKRMESLSTVKRTLQRAMSSSLTRILTPKQSVDILSDISAARRRSAKPYTIVFCGVNGVGKSTSLSKVCYFLQTNGLKVLMAACDTFRAGAVEQLRVHARCLDVEVFERGYGKDAASVAREAVRYAEEKGIDVVLVDTAGRMQDNEPLMKSLAKLVEVNTPDRVFFVGEALVGNDAVDQLTKFHKALITNQPGASPRTIDGIVLTKFDTIDDKVGAAVSMVYSTGQPIVFVGVGQTYMDLRNVNTESLVRALLR